MLGKKQKEIERLQGEIDAIRRSSTYHLAQDIKREVDAVVANEGIGAREIAGAQEEIYQRLRARELERRIGQLATKGAAAAVSLEKEQIEAEAQAEVARRAAAAVQEFHDSGEAATFRQQTIERLAAAASRNAVALAKLDIAKEEAERLGVELQANAPKGEGVVATADVFKKRAQEIRKYAKRSGILEFASLLPDDEITVCFVAEGQGHRQLTDSWGSYDRSPEQRRLTLQLIEAESGLFRVVADSWMKDTSKKERMLRAGRNLLISAHHPDTGEPASIIVKGGPLDIQVTEGVDVVNPRLDVWWVNLGDFRAMS